MSSTVPLVVLDSGLRAVISFQTLEELWFGVLKGDWGPRRRNQLRQHLEQYEVAWATPELVNLSANIRNEREKAGRRLSTGDAWIAATALMLQCPLASHDRRFDRSTKVET